MATAGLRNFKAAALIGIGLGLAAASVSAPALAQTEQDRLNSINARLDWMENALIELQADVGQTASDPNVTGAPMRMFDSGSDAAETSGDPAVARALSRIDALETQIRELTNQVEQMTFKISQANREIESLSQDTDYRLRVLEGTADGATPPPARPAPTEQAPVEQSLGTVSTAAGGQAPSGDYQEDYDSALGFLRKGDHSEAEQSLKLFLQHHGDSDLAGHAQYWLGESYYVREMWRPAAQSFLICVQKYKDGPKAPDCMLKLGMSLTAMGERAKGCQTLSEVARRFPDASQTILARAQAERQRSQCTGG